MKLFDDIYSAYFIAVEHVLASAPLTKRQLHEQLFAELSEDGAVEAETKLLDGTWPLLTEKNGRYYSVLEHTPSRPYTHLERAYLRALIDDPRSVLFLNDEQLESMRARLSGDTRMFSTDEFFRYDRASGGDEVSNPAFRENCQLLLGAMREDEWVRFDYLTRKNRQMSIVCRPLTMEYSGKDDRFRLHDVDAEGSYNIHLLSAIEHVKITEPPELYVPVSEDAEPMRCKQPILLEIMPQRNALNRFMMQFSYLEKISEYNAETGCATVRLWYPIPDEREIIIRLLGFGASIRVREPKRVVDEMRRRIRLQAELLREDDS